MWTSRNRIYAQKFFNADGPGGGGGENPPITPPVTPPKPQFDAAQQQAINDMLAKERKATEERMALQASQDRDAAEAAAKAQRDQEDAERKGEYETAKSQLEKRATDAESERDGLKADADALKSYFDTEYTAALKDLPEVVTAFKPADDASFIEKSAWLTKAREQAAKVAGATTKPGNGPNPPVSDGKFDLDAATSQAKASGAYTA